MPSPQYPKEHTTNEIDKNGVQNPSMKTLLGGMEAQCHTKEAVTKLVGKFVKDTERVGDL